MRNAMISDPAVTATIFIDFPKEGDISKSEFSEKYVSVFEKEWIAIEETIKKDTTLKKLLEEKENSVILKDSSKTPLLSLLLSWIISVVSFSSMESVKLDNVLRVNTWKFYHSISFSVGPLFLVTVYNMFTKVCPSCICLIVISEHSNLLLGKHVTLFLMFQHLIGITHQVTLNFVQLLL